MFSRIRLILQPALRAFCVAVFGAQVVTGLIAAAHLVWTPTSDMVVIPTEWAVGKWAEPVVAFAQNHPSAVLAGMLATLGAALTLIYRRLFLGRPQGWPTWIVSQILAFALAGPMLAAQVGWLVGLSHKTPIGATRLFRYWVRKAEVDESSLTAVYTNWLNVWGPAKGLNPTEVAYLAGHAPDAARRLLTPDSLAEFTREQLNALAESLSASAVDQYLLLKAASTAEAVATHVAATGISQWVTGLGFLALHIIFFVWAIGSISDASVTLAAESALPKITQVATAVVEKNAVPGVIKAVLPAVTFAAESTARSVVEGPAASAAAAAALAKAAAAESTAAASAAASSAESATTAAASRAIWAQVDLKGTTAQLNQRIDSMSIEVKQSLAVGAAAALSASGLATTIGNATADIATNAYTAATAVDTADNAAATARAAAATAVEAKVVASDAYDTASEAYQAATEAKAAATAAAATAPPDAKVISRAVARITADVKAANDTAGGAYDTAETAYETAVEVGRAADAAKKAADSATATADAAYDAATAAQRTADAATASNAALVARIDALERSAAVKAAAISSNPATAAADVSAVLTGLDQRVSHLTLRADLCTNKSAEQAIKTTKLGNALVAANKVADKRDELFRTSVMANTRCIDRNTSSLYDLCKITATEAGPAANTTDRVDLDRRLRAQLATQAPALVQTLERPDLRPHSIVKPDERMEALRNILSEGDASGATTTTTTTKATPSATATKATPSATATKATPSVKATEATPSVKAIKATEAASSKSSKESARPPAPVRILRFPQFGPELDRVIELARSTPRPPSGSTHILHSLDKYMKTPSNIILNPDPPEPEPPQDKSGKDSI